MSNAKLTHDFWNIHLLYSPQKFKLFTKISLVFFFENAYFTRSSSSSSFIYNIVIVINTPTTMNKLFQTLNALKINIFIILISYTHKPLPFHFLSYFIPKSKRFYFKFYNLIRVTQVHDSWSRTSG